MHYGDQRHLGLCLGYVPALAYGSCRVSDQGTTLRASDLHNARATILNPFNRAHYDVIVMTWLHFCQTRSAWSVDQGSTRKRSAVHDFVPTVTKFCVMWEGLPPHDTEFGNCMSEIIDRRVIISWSLIHGSSWSGLIKVGPGSSPCQRKTQYIYVCHISTHSLM